MNFEWWGHPGSHPEGGDARGTFSHARSSSQGHFDGGRKPGCGRGSMIGDWQVISHSCHTKTVDWCVPSIEASPIGKQGLTQPAPKLWWKMHGNPLGLYKQCCWDFTVTFLWQILPTSSMLYLLRKIWLPQLGRGKPCAHCVSTDGYRLM